MHYVKFVDTDFHRSIEVVDDPKYRDAVQFYITDTNGYIITIRLSAEDVARLKEML